MPRTCTKQLCATVFAFFVVSATAHAAMAGPSRRPSRAHDRGDYVTALRLIRPLAEQGDADAQYNLGNVYVTGKGVPKDGAEAAKWFRRAADQGHATAQYNLGVLFGGGWGVPQNYAEAAKWYRLAAGQGHANAPVQPRRHATRKRNSISESCTSMATASRKTLPRR